MRLLKVPGDALGVREKKDKFVDEFKGYGV